MDVSLTRAYSGRRLTPQGQRDLDRIAGQVGCRTAVHTVYRHEPILIWPVCCYHVQNNLCIYYFRCDASYLLNNLTWPKIQHFSYCTSCTSGVWRKRQEHFFIIISWSRGQNKRKRQRTVIVNWHQIQLKFK